MNNERSKHELMDLWDAAQHILKNPVSNCFSTAEMERFAEQHWQTAQWTLDLLVKAQADWLRLAMRSRVFNGSQATAMQQAAQNWGVWANQLVHLQQAAWVQWRNLGLSPFSLAGAPVTKEAWQDFAKSWQQGAQKMVHMQQNLVSTLARSREKPSNANHDPAETPSGQRTAA